jgi:hypothetical protein
MPENNFKTGGYAYRISFKDNKPLLLGYKILDILQEFKGADVRLILQKGNGTERVFAEDYFPDPVMALKEQIKIEKTEKAEAEKKAGECGRNIRELERRIKEFSVK